MSKINCPHCFKSIGGAATEGGSRVRLSILLVDADDRIHGPCPFCKADVTIATNATLSKAIKPNQPVPALRIRR